MKTAIRWPAISAVVACAFLAGCALEKGKDGAPGAPGATSLVQLTPEPPGANCANGGTRVQSGVDADADGVLDPGEISATQFVCNGAAGHDSLLALMPEPAGTNCANGGTRVQSGLDDDDDGTLDPAEVAATQYVCTGATGANGRASLVETIPEAAGAHCAAGGLLVRSGFDANANGALDAGEVVLSQYLCNGVNGLDALIATTPEAAGANCEFGGTRVDSGIDANANRILDEVEATATQYVCNGAPGASGLNALIALTPEPAGASCANGGTRVDAGIDLDADGALDAGEVRSTGYVCDGADGANGHTSLVVTTPEAAGSNCEFAGLRIQSGIDDNANLTLDDAEVDSTSHVCNGAPGEDGAPGANGQTSLVETSAEPAGANCAWGGIRVVSGLDADGNGTLDGADPVLMQYVCDGAPGLTSLVATTPEAAGARCAWGGIRIDSGLDTNRNGALDAGELTSTYVCNGADGLSALVATAPEPAGTNCGFGGTRIDSGIDANHSGGLDAGELTSTYVCDGAPAPEPLVATTAEPPGANCEFGGSRIDFATDSNANGVIDPGEIEATAYACNGATGPTLQTVLAFTPEPPGANCPYGGTKVESGLDLNGNGVLDAGEATSTGYVCDGDSRHPYVASASPAPGSPYIAPDTRFCVTFSEPVVASYVDASSFFLVRMNGPAVPSAITYDAATSTACLQPTTPLDLFAAYTLYVNSRVRDAAGNRLLPPLTATYFVQPPPAANLTVRIDSITAAGDGVDVAYTVSNSEGTPAPAFTLGFYIDPPSAPGVYSTPDFGVDFGGLDPFASTSTTVHLTAPVSALIVAYVDVWGAVVETSEDDNLGRLWPAITGTISASATTVEELATLTVTFPVNGSVRYADVFLGADFYSGPSWWVAGGPVNGTGEGFASFTFQVPPGAAAPGVVSIWCTVSDTWEPTQYAAVGWVSTTNLAMGDPIIPGWFDSGIPLTFVTVTLPTSPNLTVSVDSFTDLGAGLLEVAYTVRNSGAGDAASSTIGFFREPFMLPGVGSPADATAGVPAIAAGSSFSATVQMAGAPGEAILAFADVGGAIAEANELDNLFVPPPVLTGPIEVDRTILEKGSSVTVTVPVGPTVRTVDVTVGQDMSWGGWPLGSMSGNTSGEGFITGTFTVPTWWPDLSGASVWVNLQDAWWYASRSYAASSWVSSTNLAVWDPVLSWIDSGIALTPVTVTTSMQPNLTMLLMSVTPSAGGLDVRYRVFNDGNADAGPFTVGIFVDPPTEPGVGATPDAAFSVAGLAARAITVATVTVPGAATSRVLGYVDLDDEVAEANENDNVGRLPGRMTGPPVVAPSTVELTGGITVTVPVNSSARSIGVELGHAYGTTWGLGGAGGNYEGEGTITGNFSIPGDAMALGDWTLFVTVWDDGHHAGRRYVLDPVYSTTSYTGRDAATGEFTNPTQFPLTTVSVVPLTHPNLTVNLGAVTEGVVPGTVVVPYTVTNSTSVDADTPTTLGFFVNPQFEPGVGSPPVASVPILPLAPGEQYVSTITLSASLADRILAFADITGVLAETNEYDNMGWPPPALIGPIVATPSTVDEGTLLTLRVPVTGTTFNAEVYLGYDLSNTPLYLGNISGNWNGEGFIEGSVTVPPGSAWLGTVPVWVYLHDDWWTRTTAYVANAAVSTTSYATSPNPISGGWTDSQIPLTFVQIIPPTRPNLSVDIDAVTDAGDGTVNVDFTVRNTGASAAAAFDVGLFVDPPSIPGVGSPTSAAFPVPSLAVGASTRSTVNVPGSVASSIFAYADVANAIDEQSETDNVDWVLPAPAMIGSPVPSVSSVPIGGAVDVTVPVSASVRRVEIYIGTLTSQEHSGPDFLIGTGTGNAGGEGSITVACSPPVGSAGDWYIWVATYDPYGLDWRGYLSYAPVSSTHYAEFDPGLDGPPSVPTTIPLTALTVTP